MPETLPPPWQISPRSTKTVRVYRAPLARPNGWKRYASITVTPDGVTAEGSAGYVLRCNTVADALGRLSNQIKES